MKYQEFLNSLFTDFGFDLRATEERTAEGVVLDVTGKDAALLHNENGELLDALETLLFQIYGRELPKEERFVVDADGFRQTRKTELLAMARFAADSVRKTGRAFTFGTLTSNERRLIHLTLQQEEDLHTESIGEGKTRRLQVSLK
jgi:spoIIIJ-associated protein